MLQLDPSHMTPSLMKEIHTALHRDDPEFWTDECAALRTEWGNNQGTPFPEENPVSELHRAVAELAGTPLHGESELLHDVAAELASQLPPETRAIFLMQLLTFDQDATGRKPRDKHFAVEFAETMGPDWCQWMYHFAVFCTRVA